MMMGLAAALFAGAMSTADATPAENVKVTGTYSNLDYNEEGGDLLGMEVKIVPAGGRLQAAVLVSEGEPAPMVVVDVRISSRKVSFKVPSTGDDSWTFEGTVSATGLKGTITYSSGTKENVTLPRRCGYWDR